MTPPPPRFPPTQPDSLRPPPPRAALWSRTSKRTSASSLGGGAGTALQLTEGILWSAVKRCTSSSSRATSPRMPPTHGGRKGEGGRPHRGRGGGRRCRLRRRPLALPTAAARAPLCARAARQAEHHCHARCRRRRRRRRPRPALRVARVAAPRSARYVGEALAPPTALTRLRARDGDPKRSRRARAARALDAALLRVVVMSPSAAAHALIGDLVAEAGARPWRPASAAPRAAHLRPRVHADARDAGGRRGRAGQPCRASRVRAARERRRVRRRGAATARETAGGSAASAYAAALPPAIAAAAARSEPAPVRRRRAGALARARSAASPRVTRRAAGRAADGGAAARGDHDAIATLPCIVESIGVPIDSPLVPKGEKSGAPAAARPWT